MVYIGIVKEIIFKDRNGSRHIPYELSVCVIVEFKESNFSEETKWRTDLHKQTHSNCSYNYSLQMKMLYYYIYSIKSL